jgi:hypothetical protein
MFSFLYKSYPTLRELGNDRGCCIVTFLAVVNTQPRRRGYGSFGKRLEGAKRMKP